MDTHTLVLTFSSSLRFSRRYIPRLFNPASISNSIQSLNNDLGMGQKISKDELLYQAAVAGNVKTVKALVRKGARFEWFDQEGKTALIAACSSPALYYVAKTLIELRANVNVSGPGRNASTPLHYAAKGGYVETVNLLLSHGADASVMNDARQTPLDLARLGGFTKVVRLIEPNISFFIGWLREFHGPGFLGALAPQLPSKRIWVVVAPCRPVSPSKAVKLELAIYNTLEDSQPRTVISLWKSQIDEPKFSQQDLVLRILDKSTGSRYELGPASDGDKQQIQLFYGACSGVRQTEDAELAIAISASIQTAKEATSDNAPPTSVPQMNNKIAETVSVNPTAPPLHDGFDEGSIHYSSIDMSPVELPNATAAQGAATSAKTDGNDDNISSCCVICLGAPVQGAFIPCGHMAGCMSCLSEIKSKKGDCPVCRAKIKKSLKALCRLMCMMTRDEA